MNLKDKLIKFRNSIISNNKVTCGISSVLATALICASVKQNKDNDIVKNLSIKNMLNDLNSSTCVDEWLDSYYIDLENAYDNIKYSVNEDDMKVMNTILYKYGLVILKASVVDSIKIDLDCVNDVMLSKDEEGNCICYLNYREFDKNVTKKIILKGDAKRLMANIVSAQSGNLGSAYKTYEVYKKFLLDSGDYKINMFNQEEITFKQDKEKVKMLSK